MFEPNILHTSKALVKHRFTNVWFMYFSTPFIHLISYFSLVSSLILKNDSVGGSTDHIKMFMTATSKL